MQLLKYVLCIDWITINVCWLPRNESEDAFSFDWSQDNNWIVPPVMLIFKTISHCKGKSVLVAPKWIPSPFWSSIVDNDGSFKSFVKDYIEYKTPLDFLWEVHRRTVYFMKKKDHSALLCYKYSLINKCMNISVYELCLCENKAEFLCVQYFNYVSIDYVIDLLCVQMSMSCICLIYDVTYVCISVYVYITV